MRTNRFAKAKYITIFEEEEVNIYNATNTEIKTTRGAALRVCRLPDKGLWQIPIDGNVTANSNLNTKTVKTKEPQSDLLRIQEPPPLQLINNVYKLKIKPDLVRYYHAAVGFPTKPSWITAIKNNHYAS